ncbi:prepilin-type N-terminal cleavage/methylation domain-containing protein [candidate division TA06 bacterium]|nr:prepilin-type N-terminal cleavage/methylation domain-containing protein [candidate division TA06 bacterium]
MSAKRILKGKGFTLIELMIVLVMLSLIVAAAMSVFIQSQKAKRNTELVAEAQQTARVMVDMLADDIRSAGFGANALAGHYPIVYAAPFDLMISANMAPYPDSVTNHMPPRAIDPGASPLPGGDLYTGGTGYNDGAETIRYSFDSDNDGEITAADRGDDLEETLTRNDSLYSLTRQVYGDNGTDNGGTVLPVGVARSNFPVRSSGTPVYPLFSYWIYNATTGKDELYGAANDSVFTDAEIEALTPVPTAQLKDISKIGVTVTTATRTPNSKGLYEIVTVTTITSITRNRPLKEAKTISGRVGLDENGNHILDASEPGIADIEVQDLTDGQIQMTANDGTYSFSVEPKTHNIKCVVPTPDCGVSSAYKASGTTDTLVNVTSVSASNVNFPLLSYTAGWANGITYLDVNNNGAYDSGTDSPLPGCSVFLKNASKLVYSGSDGSYCLVAEPGNDSLICRPPSIDYVPSSISKLITITGNAYTTNNFGFKLGGKGIIRGKVYRDAAPIGSYNNEAGIGNVRIVVYQGPAPATERYITDGYTESDGTFRIEAPEALVSDPYNIVETDSAGWVSTTPNRVYIGALAAGDSTSMKYFGDVKIDTVRIPAAKVLCMTVKNFFEWQTTTATNDTATAKRDPDIVLGTKYVSTSTGNIRGWFSKRYKIDNSQETVVKNLFDAAASIYMYEKVTGTAADIKSIASDTLDDMGSKGYTGTNGNINFYRTRPDLVLGLDNTAVSSPTYNVVVWPTINNDSATTSSRGRAQWTTNIPSTPNFKLTAVDARNKVNAVVTGNFDSNGFPDIVAGYSGTTANTGGFVLWINTAYTGYTGNWTNKQVRQFPDPPAAQQFTGMGEVKGLAAGNLLGDSKTDLVAGLRTGDYQGEIRIYTGAGASPWFNLTTTLTYAGVQGEVTGIKILDCNNDSRSDIIAIVKTENYKGEVQLWLNNGDNTFGRLDAGNWIPTYVAELSDGEPISLDAAKMNWATAIYPHVVVGLKTGTFSGKTLMFDCDGGVLPETGTDPSYGMFTGEVATVGIGDFNLDGHMDIAVAERKSDTEGNLIIYFPVFQ